MRSHEDDVAEAIIEAILRSLWAYRVELTLASAYGSLGFLANYHLGQRTALLVQAIVVSLVLSVPPLRKFVGRRLRHARLRRQWARAVRSARIASLNDRVPAVRRIKDIPAVSDSRSEFRSEAVCPNSNKLQRSSLLHSTSESCECGALLTMHPVLRSSSLDKTHWPSAHRSRGPWPQTAGQVCGSQSPLESVRTVRS
jgi:hypothetical protein